MRMLIDGIGILASTFSDSEHTHLPSPTSQTSSLEDTMSTILEPATITTRNSGKRKLDIDESNEQGPTEKKSRTVNGVENSAPGVLGRPKNGLSDAEAVRAT